MKSDIVDELFKKYYNEALLYTIAISENETVAEDIVQTAFFKALEAPNESIREFKPWLLAVCRNEFFGMARRKKFLADSEPDENHPDRGESALERIIRQEEYQELYRAIAKLKDNQREVIELFYFSNLSAKDIAMIIGSSESNVKVLLYRARISLREQMEV